MTAAATPPAPSTPVLRRTAGIDSFVGSTVEWYDFSIHGTAPTPTTVVGSTP